MRPLRRPDGDRQVGGNVRLIDAGATRVRERLGAPLGELTTLGVGGPAARLVEATTDEQVVEAVAAAEAAGEPMLVLAGGSNLVVADRGFDGTVVRILTRGVTAAATPDGVRLEAAAGEPWDDLVARAVEDGLAGVEALSGIPGSSGATPIQNVGAYGQEVASTIAAVRAYDRRRAEIVDLPASACGFAYRSSRFRGSGRYVVLRVHFRLRPDGRATPIRYRELATALEVATGARPPLAEVRAAVLEIRRGKGMVLDPDDPDTMSAGSFFVNPILAPEDFAALARRVGRGGGEEVRVPAWPEPDGRLKVSAAWLIERAGFRRGYARGRAGISGKHTLALVNRGGARTSDVLTLAREIRRGVRDVSGVTLEPEPTLVGVSL